jgi:hypothetical protein
MNSIMIVEDIFYNYEVILHTPQLHTSIAYNLRLTILQTLRNTFFLVTARGISPLPKKLNSNTGINPLTRHLEPLA